jgi:hypothetical protein
LIDRLEPWQTEKVLPALLTLASPPAFTPPQPWALGFAAPPRLPFVGDVDHDGRADLIVVYPKGDCIVDVNLTVEGVKSGGGFQALTGWGKDCQAATVGEFDSQPGADVVGLFEGKTLRLAGSFKDGKYNDTASWATLPKVLSQPVMSSVDQGILVFSGTSGEGFLVGSDRMPKPVRLPRGLVWLGDAGDRWAAQNRKGDVLWLQGEPGALKTEPVAKAAPGSRPAAAGGVLVYGDTVWTKSGSHTLAKPGLPEADVVRALGDVDADGDLDIVEFRYGSEKHTGNAVLLRRGITPGETDPDRDGLEDARENELGTDPLDPDTDNDGYLDGWEVGSYRGLDFKALGCDPKKADAICLVSRFESVDEKRTRAEFDRAIRFYKELKDPIELHPVFVDPIKGDDTKNPWWANRDKFRPEKWRGLVHWMQVTPGGGGQADELGDGGPIGEGAMWAVFVHEFGHQMGLNHEGFWPNFLCPTYTSLMNYAYSYSLEDDREKIRYSDGSLNGYVLNETDLDETIPLPYERVKFLEKGPYRFRLKPNGDTTLIDWNWNGVFGEKHVRADINYSYSTNAGTRDDVGKTQASPWLFVHRNKARVLSVMDGALTVRTLKEPFKWEEPVTIESGGVTGDPVAVSLDGKVVAFYQTGKGVVSRTIDSLDTGAKMTNPVVVDPNPELVPTIGIYQGHLYLFLWNPKDGSVGYRVYEKPGQSAGPFVLDVKSTNPVGFCEDTKTGEAILGMAQNQDDKRPNRWQIRHYRVSGSRLRQTSMDWVEGKDGQARGTGRVTVLYEPKEDRVYLYGRGMTTKETAWACTYVAHQIADKSVHGGWLVKRFYDEWTQSRSAPAAAWFGGDVIWAYRWVDGGGGPTDNNLHVGYKALGIQTEPMGDHDDIGFIHTFGMRYSLLSLGKG